MAGRGPSFGAVAGIRGTFSGLSRIVKQCMPDQPAGPVVTSGDLLTEMGAERLRPGFQSSFQIVILQRRTAAQPVSKFGCAARRQQAVVVGIKMVARRLRHALKCADLRQQPVKQTERIQLPDSVVRTRTVQ